MIDTRPSRPRPHAAGAVLTAISAATVLVVGFVAAINLAAPLISRSSLRPTPAELLWIVDAYVVLFACLVIPGGALGDRLGRKGVLLAGLLLFALGAATSAAAGTAGVLIVGRAVTGVGAALVLPNGLAVLLHATPPEHRRRSIAIWAAMSGVGGVVGNVGGGALLVSGSWRLLFIAVVPIAVALAAWIAAVAPRSPHGTRPVDVPGAVGLTVTITALLAGIIEGPHAGWASPVVLGSFAAAALTGAIWVLVELRSARPMIDPRLFRIPMLSAAVAGMVVAFFGNFALFFVNASLLQYSRGFDVLGAGLGILPLSVPLLLLAPRVPNLVLRFGAIAVLAVSFGATAAGLAGLATTAHGPYAAYAVWLVVVGVGVALALPTLTVEISAALPPEQAGVGGGLQSAARELGSALGVAVIGTVVSGRLVGSSLPPSAGAYADAATAGLALCAGVVLVAGAIVTGVIVRAARHAASDALRR